MKSEYRDGPEVAEKFEQAMKLLYSDSQARSREEAGGWTSIRAKALSRTYSPTRPHKSVGPAIHDIRYAAPTHSQTTLMSGAPPHKR
jgi:hypothetical protein